MARLLYMQSLWNMKLIEPTASSRSIKVEWNIAHETHNIWSGKHRWPYFHARCCTTSLCKCGTCVGGCFWDDADLTNDLQEVQISHCDFLLWGCAKDEVYHTKPRTLEKLEARIQHVITNVPHNVHRKTGFHPRSLEETDGRHRCLHWILRYASVFPFNNVHIKLISINLYPKYRIYNPFSRPSYFPPTLY
jgi:hypothetical protein